MKFKEMSVEEFKESFSKFLQNKTAKDIVNKLKIYAKNKSKKESEL